MELRFWRTKKGEEVDFVLLKNRVPLPIEVKSDMKKLEIPSGMMHFLKRYPQSPFGIVVNHSIEKVVERPDLPCPLHFILWSNISNLAYLKIIQ